MNANAAQLLRHLEPAVRPIAAPVLVGAPGALIERGGFDELLALASRGALSSGRAVGVATGAALEPALTTRQLERLAPAADHLEAHGATRGLLLLDGRGLVVEIPERLVTGELSGAQADAPRPIDAALAVPPDSIMNAGPAGASDAGTPGDGPVPSAESAAPRSGLAPPPVGVVSPAVARALAGATPSAT